MDETLLQSMTDAIVEEVHPETVVLFGSYARGDAHAGSDLDLLVVTPDSEEVHSARRHITGNLYRRLSHYPVGKDILLYTHSEVERWREIPGH
ncbi:MAG: nucleotidyltransferase domain-containing protein, partial [Candidatus Hydrogenedentes bacterium]|nr:nucleotidyltransferase domain-containing protein [Candidatus Hydrogenedentota bacterium]